MPPTGDVDLAPGQHWGYRARSADRLAPVEVVRLGTRRPLRVLVRFLDRDQEGREDWVPPSRLKVPWSGAEAWQERDDRWQAVQSASGDIRDTTEEHAAWMVFEALPDYQDQVDLGFNRTAGVLQLRDAAALREDLGLTVEELGHRSAFQDGDRWVVPWPVTQVVLSRLARRYADRLLPVVAEAEDRAQREARWGVSYRDGHISAETCREVDAKYAPARDLVRQWCGQAATDRQDELVALRAEVVRLGQLAEAAITALRAAGSTGDAERLERELGVPLETIRAQRARER